MFCRCFSYYCDSNSCRSFLLLKAREVKPDNNYRESNKEKKKRTDTKNEAKIIKSDNFS